MRIPRIYFDGPLVMGSEVILTSDQAHYLGRVLRLKAGRPLVLFNGQGGEFQAEVSALDRKSGAINLLEYVDVDRESPLYTNLAAALSKGDRFDWLLQKVTELGVTSIQPLLTERTEVRLSGDRLDKKMQHWLGVIRSACEQSGRTMLPELHLPKSFDEFLVSDQTETRVILDPRGSISIADMSLGVNKGRQAVSIAVGPEGGFSDAEIGLAKDAGYLGIRVGPRILRTETAPIGALAAIQAQYGDWQ